MTYNWQNPYISNIDDADERNDVEGQILLAALGIEDEDAEDLEAYAAYGYSK